jgi:hypothetical protein
MDSGEKLSIDLLNIIFLFTDYQPNIAYEIDRVVTAIDIPNNPNL